MSSKSPSCQNIFRNLFPKVYFGEVSEGLVSLEYAGMEYEVVRSIYRNEALDYIIKRYHRLPLKDLAKQVGGLIEKYGKEPEKLARKLSQRFKHPPYALLKRAMKNSKLIVADEILDEIGKLDEFTGPGVQQKGKNNSLEFEKMVGEFLTKQGLVFQTEDDLRKEGRKSTPDFYLPKKNIWVDAKSFYGCNNDFTRRIIIKQTRKYIKDFSPNGMFLFRYGVHQDIHKSVPEGIVAMEWDDFLNKGNLLID